MSSDPEYSLYFQWKFRQRGILKYLIFVPISGPLLISYFIFIIISLFIFILSFYYFHLLFYLLSYVHFSFRLFYSFILISHESKMSKNICPGSNTFYATISGCVSNCQLFIFKARSAFQLTQEKCYGMTKGTQWVGYYNALPHTLICKKYPCPYPRGQQL